MLEPIVRSHLPRLQGLYDKFPSPARHVLTSMRGWLLAQIRYSPETFKILRELRASEAWTPRQVAAHQLTALRQVLDHAIRAAAFYSDYRHREIGALEDLQKLPILDRDTVLENQDALLSRATPSHRRIFATTTGTTGTPLRVAYAETFLRANWAFVLRQWAWAGVSPRHPRVTLQGSRIVPAERREPPYWTFNAPERQILLSVFHLSEKTAQDYLDFLKAHGGRVLEGFPSVLSILADFALERGVHIPMRAVFTSGEPLYGSARTKLEKAFQARVFDTYGMTEYCGLIQQCEHRRMHLAPEYGFLEILDENGKPAGPGEEGDFVWTGFLNEAMPLIRYRIGDRGRWDDSGPCACGRASALVVPTITRESDILRCPDGRVFSPRALNQILKQSDSLRFCQFVHDRPDRVSVRAVPRSEQASRHAAEEIMDVREKLQTLLGRSMQVTAQLGRSPISRRGGKIPLILNETVKS